MTVRTSFLLLVMLVSACGLAVSGASTETDAGGPDVVVPVEDGGSTSGGVVEAPDAGDDASPADASPSDASPSDASLADASPADAGRITLAGIDEGRSSGTSLVQADLSSIGDLFLAAIATKPRVEVTSVSGVASLVWTQLKVQCGEDNQTGIAVWTAKRTTDGAVSGTVTATFNTPPTNAVMAVTAYTGASRTGSVVSANTHGVAGGCSDDGDGDAAFLLNVAQPPGSVLYGAIALRSRTVVGYGAGNAVFHHVHQGASAGDIAGLAILGTPTPLGIATTLSGTLNGNTGWVAVGVELLP